VLVYVTNTSPDLGSLTIGGSPIRVEKHLVGACHIHVRAVCHHASAEKNQSKKNISIANRRSTYERLPEFSKPEHTGNSSQVVCFIPYRSTLYSTNKNVAKQPLRLLYHGELRNIIACRGHTNIQSCRPKSCRSSATRKSTHTETDNRQQKKNGKSTKNKCFQLIYTKRTTNKKYFSYAKAKETSKAYFSQVSTVREPHSVAKTYYKDFGF
jgi:hypothetical protein